MRKYFVLVLVFLFAFASSAAAAERGTADEAQVMVKKAVAYWVNKISIAHNPYHNQSPRYLRLKPRCYHRLKVSVAKSVTEKKDIIKNSRRKEDQP
ncbi:MAG TPA: hypothetical protein PK587_03020 [Syntrophales bacterium]|nr:hypothetical protein [Syntrophales bacterium]